MTRTSRSVSFTQDHYNLLDRVARERRKGFSETLRRIIDFVLDHDSSLGLPFYADREKSLQTELLTIQEAKKKLEEERKSKIGDSAGMPPPSSGPDRVGAPAVKTVVTSFADKRPPRTDEEQFLIAASYVATEDKAITPDLKRKVLSQAREHPIWLAKVQEPERNKLEALLKIPKIGGR